MLKQGYCCQLSCGTWKYNVINGHISKQASGAFPWCIYRRLFGWVLQHGEDTNCDSFFGLCRGDHLVLLIAVACVLGKLLPTYMCMFAILLLRRLVVQKDGLPPVSRPRGTTGLHPESRGQRTSWTTTMASLQNSCRQAFRTQPVVGQWLFTFVISHQFGLR